MSRTTLRRPLAGLAALSLLAGGATAAATAAPSAAPVASGGGAPAGAPVPITEFNHVTSDVRITDGSGGVVERFTCEWREPGEEDRPCLAFAGDPDAAIDKIRSAGGQGATIRVTSPEIGLDSTSTISRRADGTWLFRGAGKSRSGAHSSGRVCLADGSKCTRWEATSAKAAKKQIRAAAARLKKRA